MRQVIYCFTDRYPTASSMRGHPFRENAAFRPSGVIISGIHPIPRYYLRALSDLDLATFYNLIVTKLHSLPYDREAEHLYNRTCDHIEDVLAGERGVPLEFDASGEFIIGRRVIRANVPRTMVGYGGGERPIVGFLEQGSGSRGGRGKGQARGRGRGRGGRGARGGRGGRPQLQIEWQGEEEEEEEEEEEAGYDGEGAYEEEGEYAVEDFGEEDPPSYDQSVPMQNISAEDAEMINQSTVLDKLGGAGAAGGARGGGRRVRGAGSTRAGTSPGGGSSRGGSSQGGPASGKGGGSSSKGGYPPGKKGGPSGGGPSGSKPPPGQGKGKEFKDYW